MPRLIAFLRAINVGGHVVTMAELRGHFEALRLKDVETFIASGNVIFSSQATDLPALQQKIESRLEKSLGYEVRTFIRTDAEVAAVARYRPFSEAERQAAKTMNVGFLAGPLDVQARKTLHGLKTDIDDFHVADREVYWLCKKGQSDSTFSNVRFEKLVKVRATWRNITTVTKLAAKYPA